MIARRWFASAPGRQTAGSTAVTVAKLVLLWVVVVAAIIWVAHLFIAAVHRGDLLPSLLENRATKPVEYYYEVINRIAIAGAFVVTLVLVIVRRSREGSAGSVLALLLIGDVMLCIASERYGGMLDVRSNGGIPEWFQYFKEGGLATLLYLTFRHTHRRIFLGWACLFGFMLIDDALRYHERIGALIGQLPGMAQLAATIEVRAVDVGEIVSLFPVLFVFLAFLAWPYLRERADGRSVVHRFGLLLAALVAVGGVMDLVDSIAVTRGSDLVQLLSLVEDGGEMVVFSLTYAYALVVYRRYAQAGPAGYAEIVRR